MILAFCIDDQGGLAFNHRRQSRDRALVADLLAAAGATLCGYGLAPPGTGFYGFALVLCAGGRSGGLCGGSHRPHGKSGQVPPL